MYIKTITIQGFKSYRDQVAIEPFSPRHNVVVGRNGSGKSNFFLAIRFVLYDAYTSMSREERASLLHEGTGKSATLSAYVEIVFDNSDGRFPTGNPELHLRRTIGMKKDEYSLDRKSATKAEITTLTNMKDSERLELLKEVAGTQVYEDRRKESLKEMDVAASRKRDVDDFLGKINERLGELEEEKEELKDYQKQDRTRRCLEYAIYQRELDDTNAAVENLEENRRRDVDDQQERNAEFQRLEEEMKALENELAKDKHSLTTVESQLRQYSADMDDLIREREELRLSIDDLSIFEQDGKTRKRLLNQEMEALKRKMKEAEKKIDQLLPAVEAKTREEKDLREQLDRSQAELEALFAKQGRTKQFRSRKERDAYLRQEIETTQASLETQRTRTESVKDEVSQAHSQLDDLDRQAEEMEAESSNHRTTISRLNADRQSLKQQMDKMFEQRKDLWREDGKLGSTLGSAKSEKQKAETSLAGMMDKNTSKGLQVVKQIAEHLNLDGVHGPLYELFEVDDKYKTAVEVTAGNSLFHVVVDDDRIATEIIAEMNKRKVGRVTFMPLNKIKENDKAVPIANDALPMVQKLKFRPEHRRAVEQVFGRTIICPDLKTAAEYTRSNGVDAITLDGDRVDRRGALTGGYHDIRRSRIDTIKSLRVWNEKYEIDAARQREVQATLTKLEQEISIVRGKVEVIESKSKRAQVARQPLSESLEQVSRERQRVQDRLSRLEDTLQDAERDSRKLSLTLASLEADLASAFNPKLTEDELTRMDVLAEQVKQYTEQLALVSGEASELANERRSLEIDLNEDLRRRLEQVQMRLDMIGSGEDAEASTDLATLSAKKNDLKRVEKDIKSLQAAIAETETEIETLTREIARKQDLFDQKYTTQAENSRWILKARNAADRYHTRREHLQRRRAEFEKKIRDLGVLPEEAYTLYVNDRPDKLVKLLHKANDALKGYSHVNKKAFEQYNEFTKQRDTLAKKREELEAAEEKIQELIQTLDQRKDEAIERTFKQVSVYFEQVFKKLVPAGKGRLVMQKKVPNGDSMDIDEPRIGKSSIASYTGVGIQVSFNSERDERLMIQQLSGGQKSLVALATVFAIQKCDPAPFYLFDEIDANLDAQYRTAVAQMIHELSSTAQFITTTFRPEMLARADKFYGVLFDNQKVSTIRTIERQDAQEFVEVAA